jgi:hypothetical protein
MNDNDLISRAAAIQIAERYGCNNGSALGHHSGAADCIASEIATLPAVDAIPVEWLRGLKEKLYGNSNGLAYRMLLDVILNMWQKEQEAQDEPKV